MKITRVSSNNISVDSLSPAHYIKQHNQSEQAYRRRLIRLFRCHYLPHHICQILSISKSEFMNNIEVLDNKAICLSYDIRKEADFKMTTPPSELAQGQRDQLTDDNQFYLAQGIAASDRCRLLQLTRSRLRELDTIEPAIPKLNREDRNAAIVKLYLETESKRGIKAKLADTFQLSRKSIDLILIQHNVDVVFTTRHNITNPRPSKAKSILALYDTMRTNGIPPIDIKNQIAAKMGCSYSYVHKVIKTKL